MFVFVFHELLCKHLVWCRPNLVAASPNIEEYPNRWMHDFHLPYGICCCRETNSPPIFSHLGPYKALKQYTFQITSTSTLCPTACSNPHQRKHHIPASSVFYEENPPVNSGFESGIKPVTPVSYTLHTWCKHPSVSAMGPPNNDNDAEQFCFMWE